MGGARIDPDPAKGVSPAHLRRHCLRQSFPPLPAASDRALQRALREGDQGRRLRARCARCRALSFRQVAGSARRTERTDERGGRGAEVRGCRRVSRPHRFAGAGVADPVGGGEQRIRRRHHRRLRQAGACLCQPGDGPRRQAPGGQAVLSAARRRRQRQRRARRIHGPALSGPLHPADPGDQPGSRGCRGTRRGALRRRRAQGCGGALSAGTAPAMAHDGGERRGAGA